MTVDISLPPLFIDLDQVATLTTLSPSTIQGMVARKEFPAPRELSSRRAAGGTLKKGHRRPGCMLRCCRAMRPSA